MNHERSKAALLECQTCPFKHDTMLVSPPRKDHLQIGKNRKNVAPDAYNWCFSGPGAMFSPSSSAKNLPHHSIMRPACPVCLKAQTWNEVQPRPCRTRTWYDVSWKKNQDSRISSTTQRNRTKPSQARKANKNSISNFPSLGHALKHPPRRQMPCHP